MFPPSNPQSVSKTLDRDEQRTLLEIARRAIAEQITNGYGWRPESAKGTLAEPRGAFVTLERRGKLRGCVGQVEPRLPLARTVAHCARAAAREDNRFAPLKRDELPELNIEISVLSPLKPLAASEVKIGRHGLVVEHGPFRGVLLPRVPVEHSWTSERFLEETCRKAGLPLDAWKFAETQVLGFTAEVFSEAGFIYAAAVTPANSAFNLPPRVSKFFRG